jgi:ATP-binding cassette, subfamily B, bacterial
MREILNILYQIPKFKRRFAIFVVAVIMSEGVAIQVIPLVDREITTLVEKAVNGEVILISSFIPYAVIVAVALLIYRLFNRTSYTLTSILREEVWNQTFRVGFAKVLFHDLEYITADRSGGLLSKLERASSKFANLFTESASALFRNFSKAIAGLIIIFSVSWEIGLGILGTMIAYSIIYWFRFRLDIPYAEKRDKFADDEFSRVWEVVPQAKITKLYTNEQKEVNNIAWIGKEIIKIVRKRERLWTYANLTEYPLVTVPTIVIKLWAAWMTINGQFGIPTFVLLYSMISIVQEPMWVINWFMWEMQDTFNRAKKYLKILRSKEKVVDPLQPEVIVNPHGDIKFEKVSFKYTKSKQLVLNKINLDFEGKKLTALVGKSGAGKSTITNMICRFFDSKQGRISLGGQDIRQMTKHDLRTQIGFVTQESFVFSGTIVENLRYAKTEATKKEMMMALKKAYAWEFIKDFEKGIETQIGERGVKLSGGQRQRLSIARAILKNPPILILDEATNSLDSESEMAIQKALKDFMKDRTVIVVAHRLSTVQNADKIYLIDDGKVQEEGNHQELIKKDGVYKMLYDIQAGGFERNQKIMQEYDLV